MELPEIFSYVEMLCGTIILLVAMSSRSCTLREGGGGGVLKAFSISFGRRRQSHQLNS